MSIHTHRNVVPLPLIDEVLRLIHQDWLRNPPDPSRMQEWPHTLDWFPHLKWNPSVLKIADGFKLDSTLCDPQILLQFPHDGPVPEISYHRDTPPKWAAGRTLARIVGVPLTQWTHTNGGIRFPYDDFPGEFCPNLASGDAIEFSGDQLHSGGINRTGSIRYGIYFRWLA